MKLAVSNIAWAPEEEREARDILRRSGVTAIEVAPTRIWPEWRGADGQAAARARADFLADGFATPSFQAILFGRPELKVFGDDDDRAAFLAHMETVAALAGAMGAGPLVFGSPKNRDPGDLSPEEAMAKAADIFRAAGEICANHGATLVIEANPSDYGCRFLTTWRDAAEFVRLTDHPNVRLHLDIACTEMAGDDAAAAARACADILAHVHISEPQLGAFDAPTADHAGFAAALRETGYDGYASLEMRRQGDGAEALDALATAVAFASKTYG
ncbi:MAG: sugar phosphate isomerase/epimerase [Parvularculaceae bacterium]